MRGTSVQFVRDRSTMLLYGQLAIWAYFIYSFTPVVPLLRIEQETSRTVASLHSTAFAVGSVVGGGLLTPILLGRFDRNIRIWAGLAGVGIGISTLMVVRVFPATIACVCFIAVCGSVAVNAMTAALADHHGRAGAAAISEANAVAAAIGLIAPMAVGGAVAAGYGWRAGMGVIVVALVILTVIAALVGVRVPADRVTAAPARPGRLPRRYWLVFFAVLGTASVEVCMNQWVAEVLRDRIGMSKGAATACVSAIIGGLVIGRFVSGQLALRFAAANMMLAGLALSAVGFSVFWIATTSWVAVAGLMICGLGNAVHFPLGMALAIEHSDGQADLATARSAWAFGFAFGVAPFILAAIADNIGTHLAFLVVPLFLVFAAAMVVPLLRQPGQPSAVLVPEVGEFHPEGPQEPAQQRQ